MRFYKRGDSVQYGYTLNEFYEMLDLMGIVDDDFNLIQYLISKGEMDENGKIIGNTYGLAKITDRTNKGLFNVIEETYIFIPAIGIRRFIKEMTEKRLSL